MIFGYFDESGEGGDGFFVIAGFIGRRRDWKKFIPLWAEALEDHGPLHMQDLRLGSPQAKSRHGDLLKRLAKVPKRSNLIPFFGSVRTSDFSQRTKGTTAEIVMQGYTLALCALVEAILESRLPKGDRIEFIFEEQIQFAGARASAFAYWRNLPDYKAHHGKSRIGKDSSEEKGLSMLEASDYLSYATLQRLINPESQKAELSSPILDEFQEIANRHLPREQAHYLLDYFVSHTGAEPKAIDPQRKKLLARELNKAGDQP